MPYDPIRGQGYGGLTLVKMASFKGYLLCQYACNQKTNRKSWYSKTLSAFLLDSFLMIILVWRQMTYKRRTFGRQIFPLTWSWSAVPYGAFFICLSIICDSDASQLTTVTSLHVAILQLTETQ